MRRLMLYCPLAALLVLSGCSNQKQASATAPSGPSDRVKLSDDATNMMADAQKARQSIAKKDKDGALRRVNDALDKLKDVQSRAAGKKVVPIYQEIETV